MKYIVFASNADVLAFQTVIDTHLGYPRGGEDVGDGMHISGVTEHFANIRKHPHLDLWAYPAPTVVVQSLEMARAALPGITIGDPVTLDPSWTVAPPPPSP